MNPNWVLSLLSFVYLGLAYLLVKGYYIQISVARGAFAAFRFGAYEGCTLLL